MSRPRRRLSLTFVVEHHFTGFGQVSASLNLLTWLGARTTDLAAGHRRAGLAVAQPGAAGRAGRDVDLLSGGRLDFGVGKGYRYNEFAGFGMPMEEADTRSTSRWRSSPRPSPTTRRGATRAILAIRQRRRRAADRAAAAPAVLDGRRQRPLGAPGRRARLPHAAGAARPRRGGAALGGAVHGARSRRAAALMIRCRSASPARYTSPTRSEELEAAYVRRFQGHLRINRLAERPGDDRARFAEHNEAAIRHHCDETAVFGTTDQICRKLEALRAGGVEYVIVNFGGSRQYPALRPRGDARLRRPRPRWPPRRSRLQVTSDPGEGRDPFYPTLGQLTDRIPAFAGIDVLPAVRPPCGGRRRRLAAARRCRPGGRNRRTPRRGGVRRRTERKAGRARRRARRCRAARRSPG